MKRRNFSIIVIAFILLVAGGYYFITLPNQPAPTGQLKIATTIFPIFDIAQQIGGDDLEVILILPPGASPHTYEPTPSQIRALQNTKIFFKVGLGLDDWADSIARSVDTAKIVALDKNIDVKAGLEHEDEEDENNQDHKGQDPHYWLDARNAIIMAQTITQELSALDPSQANTYQTNLAILTEKLNNTHKQVKNQLSELKRNKLLVFHDSWNYFAQAYGLEIIAAVEPSPGREPTPQYLQNLTQQINQYNISVVFSEPQLPIDTIKPFLDDLNLSYSVLDPIGGVPGRDSYIELLNYNANTIKAALKYL
ncbi:MAG: hypothetical protein COT81_04905 [Candidatus Buchananbacteria bacterium CG10_big_fil_rev_8_21_14_0_10_42_9]|uniref:Zinc ABC transporter substrate-binding protein n=1 Tax=Candidatus Buchananbacteria bacterium CG10_big_fil_rev_8_21_14_0_10_42_9 TaxID=1974526 RepID=A0A2H0W049_9BACT|nr:MAG: hypothetical protein COT81_04905 [Candidatus Buchananbacteria bacterium CG10_big_fil_rev_8_21_14_0_10_42_9]